MENYNKTEFLKFKETVRNLLNEAFPLPEGGDVEIENTGINKDCKAKDYGKTDHYNDTYKTKNGDVRRIKMSTFGNYRHWFYKSEEIEPKVKEIIETELNKKGWDWNWIDPGYVVIRFKK